MIGKLPSYDVLRDMAENNPDQLESLRREMSEQIINSASEKLQKRLRGLQFQIDMRRRQAKSPLAACILISQMMHQSFGEFRYVLNEACNNPQPIELEKSLFNTTPDNSATILPFARQRDAFNNQRPH